MHKFGYLVTLLEEHGIRVKSAGFGEDGLLNIDVDDKDESRAVKILEDHWKQQWEYEHIGLVAVPKGSDSE